ncbi:unnamed protein product [Orchesella dallaii]|uniref:Uncharacterized protein n=1 Tax=Orchesella dallaii TaxID=48710 RepID=A0ABP1Q8V4_9HEXA
MSSFSDEDDEFLSVIELDEITALERQHNEEAEEENWPSLPGEDLEKRDQDRNDGKEFQFRAPQSPSVGVGEIKMGTSTATSSYVRGTTGSFIFKAKNNQPSSSAAPQPSTSKPQLPEKPEGEGKKVEDDDEDASWKKFVKWFEKQPRFQTPWVKAIPLFVINDNQCMTIIKKLGENNFSQLIDFTRQILSFSNKVHQEIDSLDGELERWMGYKGMILNQLNAALLRFKEIVIIAPNQFSQQDMHKLDELLEEVLQTYLTKKMDFTKTSIPEVLVQLYPKGYEETLKVSVRESNVEQLLPLCEKSPENLLKALSFFHSETNTNAEGSMLSEGDKDFQVCTQSSPAKMVAQKLLEALKGSLGLGFVSLLPTLFQPLFSFEAAVMFKNPKFLVSNSVVIEEIFELLNTLLIQCEKYSESEDFTWFVVLLSSNTSRILKQEKFRSSIQFKKWPCLWKYVRKFRSNT